ncbi:prolyl oligopeptidase family serine peptidase [Streptomyces sp. NPDC005423]|uniref:prolyl oligopeptidase family serine peptidase n=1 Tax=Streptomyces sp. NPDC005423 TaxID=3155343 RepID=UPI0033B5445F
MAPDARDQVTGDRGGAAAEELARFPTRPGAEATGRAPHAPRWPRDGSPDPGAPAGSTGPAMVPLPDTAGARDAVTRLHAYGCWYPSADPDGTQVAFICDRGGVPQLWAGPVNGEGVRLLDSAPDPVTEVSWSPDGRWIAYTTAPGGGEHARVLCVRPDGTGRRLLAGGGTAGAAHLGCWAHDGSVLAVTVASPALDTDGRPAVPEPDESAPTGRPGTLRWLDGKAGGHGDATPLDVAARPGEPGPVRASGGATVLRAPSARPAAGLSAYLVDPDGASAPVLLAAETHAATLRVCDLSPDGRLALLRRGPRGRREAVVRRTADSTVTFSMPVADGDPWIGRFSPDGRTLWLRSNADREYAALLAVAFDAHGRQRALTVAAERDDQDLELLSMAQDGRTAVLAWNAQGATELELVETFPAPPAPDRAGPARPVALPHEVVTRVAAAGSGRLLIGLSGSQRRPGIWWAHEGVSLLRTPWSSRDEDAVPPGRPPVRPAALRFTARDGLPLSGWYYRAPGRAAVEPAPCVLHLHGGPEEQERPVLAPLYHELLGRGLDVFAPDVRGSSGHGKSFVDADLGTGRFAAIDDVADCAGHAVAAGLADPTRLAVMGRSYGGYLVFASLVWHPELFRTGVAVCGMSDLPAFFAGTEPWIAESAVHKYGHPERDRDLLRALSPMNRVDALRVPVLAVHGEHDTNVRPAESERFVRAARERGVPAELLTLRDEGHDFLRADNRRLFRRSAADWLERHLLR